MKFTVIKKYGEEPGFSGPFFEIIPKEVADEIGVNSIITACVENDGEIIASLVLNVDAGFGEKKVARIADLFVEPDFGRRGIGSELIEFTKKRLSEEKVSAIYVKTMGSEEDIHNLYNFFRKNNFLPLVCFGHQVTYSIEEMRKSPHAAGISKSTKSEKRIISLTDNKDRRLREFILKAEKNNAEINPLTLDLNYCKFFLEDDEIKAAAFAKLISDNHLFISSFYIDPMVTVNLLANAVYVAVIVEAGSKLPPDTKITLQLIKNEGYEFTKRILGEPQTDLFFQEFIAKCE